jgi:hypothetical protein
MPAPATAFRSTEQNDKGIVLRKFALLLPACLLFLFAALAHAQQIDVAVGASTLYSSATNSAAQGYIPPAEKGGLYPTFTGDVLFKKNNRLGVNLEIAIRAKQGLYNGYQDFRPVFTDANALYVIPTSKRTKAELMAGVGLETVIFYNHFGICNSAYLSCTTYVNANHFMAHIGGGVRYYFWRRFFLRPEIHLYVIPNNSQFNSDYVGRAAATIGYSFAPR